MAVTGKFTFDQNGYWQTDTEYNPTLGMYRVSFETFVHTESEYKTFMENARTSFTRDLSVKAPSQDLATNLLNWMAYSYFVPDSGHLHRWRALPATPGTSLTVHRF